MNIDIWDLVLVELLLNLFFLVVMAFYIGEYVFFVLIFTWFFEKRIQVSLGSEFFVK